MIALLIKMIKTSALPICLPLILIGCASDKAVKTTVDEQHHIMGVVTQVNQNTMLISINDSGQTLIGSDSIKVPLLKDSMIEFIFGDEVLVCFDGTVKETHPTILGTVYDIAMISPSYWSNIVEFGFSAYSGSIEPSSVKWRITKRHQVDQLRQWFSGLSLTKKQFTDDEHHKMNWSLAGLLLENDYECEYEVYEFTLFYENCNWFNFSYGERDKNRGILFYDGEWYDVKNPISPFDLNLDNMNDNPVDFSYHYVRTNNREYNTPFYTIIKSKIEFDQYVEKHLLNHSKISSSTYPEPISRTSPLYELSDLIATYTDDFFADNYLAIVTFAESSGSVRHNVENINVYGDVFINRFSPMIGTMDMGYWSIIIELTVDFVPDAFNFVTINR